jgi:ubiquinone/menaquinone biosynthesis C-methylase UbiE
VKPRADELDDIRRFYDSIYHQAAMPYSRASTHLRRLVSKVGILRGQWVLDVACGAGQWLHAMSEAGAIPHGVDLSQTAIDVCRKVMPAGTFHAQAAEALPFDDGLFDHVSCLGALEHFVDARAALMEMVRVSKPDATILLLVPNADFPPLRLGLYSGTAQTAAKEEVLTLEEWKRLFESCGLEVRRRWRDLHVLSWSWISSRGPLAMPLRAAQALALAVWPLQWQYQVYHLCGITRQAVPRSR